MDKNTKKRFADAALKTFDFTSFENVKLDAASNTMMSNLDELLELNDPKLMNQRHDFF